MIPIAEGFRIATAFVQVSPDTEGFAEDLEAKVEEAAAGVTAKVKIGADTSDLDAKADEAKAKVDELDGKTASAKLDADSADLDSKTDSAKAKVDEVAAKSAKPKLDADDADLDEKVDDAKAKVDDLDGKTASPKLGADDADAKAKIADLQAQIQRLKLQNAGITIDADATPAEMKIAELEAQIETLKEQGSSVSIGGEGSMLGAVTMGVGSLLPGIGGAAAGLGMLGGVGALAFGGIAKALSSAHQASQNLGMTGAQVASQQFSNAVQAQQAQQQVSAAEQQQAQDSVQSAASIQQAQQQVAQASQQSAEDQITSAQSIEQAQMSLAETVRNAAASEIQAEQQVAQSQQGLEESNYSLSEAQYNLTQAWVTARENIINLNNALADSKLNVQQAQLAVSQAEYQQMLVDQNAYSTDLDRQQAALAVAQAKQQVTDATAQESQAQYSANLANQQGVNGSQTVIQAKQAVTQANYGQQNSVTALEDAQRNLTDTTLNNAAQVKEAQMQVAAAEQQAAYTQMRDAQAVAQAQQNLALAQEQASYQQQRDAIAVQQAQQNLSNTIKEQQLAWASTMSTENQAANQFAADMARLTPAGRAFVNEILGMRGAFRQLEAAAQNAVLPAATSVMRGLSSLMPTITAGVTRFGDAMGKSFAQFGQALGSSGARQVLSGLISNGIEFANTVLPAFASFAGQLAILGSRKGAVTGLADALAGIGRGLAGFAHGLTPYIPAFNQILEAAGKLAQAFGPALAKAIGQVAQALLPLARFLNSKSGGPFIDGLAKVLAYLTVFKGAMKILPDFITGPLSKLGKGVIEKLITDPFKAGASKLGGILGGAAKSAGSSLLSSLKSALGRGGMFDGLRLQAMYAWDGIKDGASKLPGALSGVWSGISSGFGKVFGSGGTVSSMISGLKGMVTGLPQMMSGVVDAIKGWGIWSSIASGATKIWTGIQAAFDAVMDANPIVLVTAAVIGIGVAVVEAYKHFAWFRTGVHDVFKAIEDAALWMWHNVFDPMWAGIEKGAEWLYDNAIKPYFDSIMTEWHAAEDAANFLWQNVIEPAFHGIGAVAEWLYDQAIRPQFQLIQNIIHDLGDVANWLWHNVFQPVFNGIAQGASAFVSGFRTIWNGLEDIFKKPVNFLIDIVYTNGIERFWNDIVKAVNLPSLKLPNIPGLAHGGVIPGYKPGHDTVPAMLSPGEAVLTPGATRAVGGEGTINALNAAHPPSGGGGGMLGKEAARQVRKHAGERPLEHALTLGKFASGGIVGGIAGAVSGAAHSVGSFVSGLVGGAIDVAKIVGDLATGNTSGLANDLGKFAKTDAQAAGLAKVMVAIPKTIAGDLVKAITGSLSSSKGGGGSAGGFSSPGTLTGSVASWFAAGVKAAGVPASWIPQLETIARYESSFNPNAANTTAAGIAAGGPVGIMQTVPGTFNAYHVPGTADSPFNPIADIAAASKYILAVYGNPGRTPGLVSLSRGGGYTGYDSGGVLPPGPTLTYNNTGQPEAILTPQESTAFVALVKRMLAQPQGGPGSGVTVVQNYNGTQQPTVEQQAIMNRNLAMALSGG